MRRASLAEIMKSPKVRRQVRKTSRVEYFMEAWACLVLAIQHPSRRRVFLPGMSHNLTRAFAR